MSNQLTAEQQRKIEENRRKALERRAQRLGQTSVGFSSTSVQVQPCKRTAASEPAPRTLSSASAPNRFVPPFKKDFNNYNQGPKHQHLSGTSNQLNQSTLYSSASSRQVRFVLQSIIVWRKKHIVFYNSLYCLSL